MSLQKRSQIWINDCDPITLELIAPRSRIAVKVTVHDKAKWAQFDAYSLSKWMFETGNRFNPLTREVIDDATLHRIDHMCQFALKNGTWWFFVATRGAIKLRHYIWRKQRAMEAIEEEIATYIRYILAKQDGTPSRNIPQRRLFISSIVLIVFKLRTLFRLATQHYKVDITVNDLLSVIKSDILGHTDTMLLNRGIRALYSSSFHS